MRRIHVMAIAVVALALLVGGCLDTGKYNLETPVEFTVSVVDVDGNSVGAAVVDLIGSENYNAVANGSGVATFASVKPGNYRVLVKEPGGLQAIVDIPVWGGGAQSATITVKDSLMADGGWVTRVYGGGATFSSAPGIGPNGTDALIITSTHGADASVGQVVQVLPHRQYRLSGWVKTEDFARINDDTRGAQWSIDEIGPGSATNPAVTAANSGWVYVERTFNSGNRRQMTVLALFGGWGHATGTAYFADPKLVQVD